MNCNIETSLKYDFHFHYLKNQNILIPNFYKNQCCQLEFELHNDGVVISFCQYFSVRKQKDILHLIKPKQATNILENFQCSKSISAYRQNKEFYFVDCQQKVRISKLKDILLKCKTKLSTVHNIYIFKFVYKIITTPRSRQSEHFE